MTMALLQLDNVMAFYGLIRALNDVSIRIEAGEIVCLLGGNASGKSTTMKTILGMVRGASGTVRFAGERIDRLPTQLIVGRVSLALYPRPAAYSAHDRPGEPGVGYVRPASSANCGTRCRP